jgi:hypothetical protein
MWPYKMGDPMPVYAACMYSSSALRHAYSRCIPVQREYVYEYLMARILALRRRGNNVRIRKQAGVIRGTADAFTAEFEGVTDADGGLFAGGVDRSPKQMIAYQLGWLKLIRSWDADELAGKKVIMSAPGLKWNKLGALYERFYEEYGRYSLTELREMFGAAVDDFLLWLDGFTEDDVFQPGGRKWASSTPSGWPVWKWVHINTVAPFKSFRSKIRKWKKLVDKELNNISNKNSDSLSRTGGEGGI